MNKNFCVSIVTAKLESLQNPESSQAPTAQIARHNEREKVALHNSCACGSTRGFLGAGRKPGEESISCSECRKFIEYRPIEKLKRQRKRKRLTDCLEILGDSGIQGDEAIFILSNLGSEA